MNNNPLQPILDMIPKPLRNRYFLIIGLFLFWMIFIDRHDLLTQWRLQSTVDELKGEMDYYSEKIEETEQERLDLELNTEKIAREKYFMTRPGEDVYIIVDEDEEDPTNNK